jgi:osmotically-inducible protein OsmY
MRNLKPLYAMPIVLFLSGLLPGCATERKCGLQGCPGDAKITESVQALIAQQPDLGPPDTIHVRTLDHVVYLSGEVSDGNMSRMAEAVALKSPGVKRVVNNIGISR